MATTTGKRSLGATELDRLVVTYAPIGVRQRRKQKIRRGLMAGGCVIVAGAGALLSYSDISLLKGIGGLAPSASTMISRSDVARLNHERAEFTAKIAQLEQQIASVRTQKLDLEAQQAEFAEQSAMLTRLLDQAGSEQTSLEMRQQQGSQLDREIAAMAAQRKALEERWVQFEAQGELLAMEIIAVNAQRKELESQRKQIDRQQNELAEMLERADGLYRRNTNSESTETKEETTTAAAAQESFTYTNNSLVVDNSKLDGLRGGFSIGEGLDVSFGFEQTGSIDGVEQFSNSFTIDSMASGFDNVDMSNMNSVLLQNGTGNFVSTSVLDSLSDSFANIIQNTLDDQVISNTTIFDITLHNVPGLLQGLSAEQALMDSLGSF